MKMKKSKKAELQILRLFELLQRRSCTPRAELKNAVEKLANTKKSKIDGLQLFRLLRLLRLLELLFADPAIISGRMEKGFGLNHAKTDGKRKSGAIQIPRDDCKPLIGLLGMKKWKHSPNY